MDTKQNVMTVAFDAFNDMFAVKRLDMLMEWLWQKSSSKNIHERYQNAIAELSIYTSIKVSECSQFGTMKYLHRPCEDMKLADRVLEDIFKEKLVLPEQTVGIDIIGNKIKYGWYKSVYWYRNKWK